MADELPQVELSSQQREFLARLAKTIRAEKDLNGQGMHDAIYAAAEVAGIKAGAAFVALYRVILGQDSGPKAGWFLVSLGTDFVVSRLEDAAAASSDASSETESERAATLPDGRVFRITDEVAKAFPQAAVGYVVADVIVQESTTDWLPQMQVVLQERGVTRDTLTSQLEISAWRQAYKSFGVKPSDFRCSVEALTRRALDGKPAAINTVVDEYNYVSVKHGLPMGAMDLEHVTGDIELRFGKTGEKAELLGVDKPVDVTDRQVVYADDKRIITWLWNYRDARDTAVTLQTKQAVFFIDSLQGRSVVELAVAELADRLEADLGAKVLAQGIVSA